MCFPDPTSQFKCQNLPAIGRAPWPIVTPRQCEIVVGQSQCFSFNIESLAMPLRSSLAPGTVSSGRGFWWWYSSLYRPYGAWWHWLPHLSMPGRVGSIPKNLLFGERLCLLQESHCLSPLYFKALFRANFSIRFLRFRLHMHIVGTGAQYRYTARYAQ